MSEHASEWSTPRGSPDWEPVADRLAAESYAAGDPTGWFDRLYTAGVAGAVAMPWDRTGPHPLLTAWAAGRTGTGPAVVVGCGLGADAEFVAGLGHRTTAFDVAPTAVEQARARNPGSRVGYRVADLLDLPPELPGTFGLVVEIFTAQALPVAVRGGATAAIAGLVAPGGTLFVVEGIRADDDPLTGPPYLFTRGEIEAFGTGLDVAAVDTVQDPRSGAQRWRAEFRRAP